MKLRRSRIRRSFSVSNDGEDLDSGDNGDIYMLASFHDDSDEVNCRK